MVQQVKTQERLSGKGSSDQSQDHLLESQSQK